LVEGRHWKTLNKRPVGKEILSRYVRCIVGTIDSKIATKKTFNGVPFINEPPALEKNAPQDASIEKPELR